MIEDIDDLDSTARVEERAPSATEVGDDIAPADERADRRSGHSRSVGRNVIALLTSQAITWVLATATLWLIPRYLGPVGVGQLGIARSMWGIASVFAGFGTGTLLVVEVARNRTTVRSITHRIIKIRLALFVVACPIVAAVMWIGPYDSRTVAVVASLGIASLVGLVTGAYTQALFGLQEMGDTARVAVAQKLALVAATIAVLAAGFGAIGLTLAEGVITAVAGVFLYRFLRRRSPKLEIESRLAGRPLVAASAVFLLAEAARVVYQSIDTVVMSLLIGEEPVGWYNAADVAFGSLLFVPVVAMTALFPRIAEIHEQDPSTITVVLRQTFESMLLISIPIGLGAVVAAPSFVELVFGDAFAESIPVLQLFGFVVILTCQTIVLGQFALATGRTRLWTMLMVGAIAISIPLDIVFVPIADERFGNSAIAGAAAYLVTESLLLITGVLLLAPAIVNRLLFGRIARCSLAGTALLVVAWPLRDLMFLIPATVAVVVYTVCILALGTLSQIERQAVGRVFSGVRARARGFR